MKKNLNFSLKINNFIKFQLNYFLKALIKSQNWLIFISIFAKLRLADLNLAHLITFILNLAIITFAIYIHVEFIHAQFSWPK